MKAQIAKWLLVVLLLTCASKCNGNSTKIFFPESLPKLVFTTEPDCAKTSKYGLCESSQDYPKELIKKAIANGNNDVMVELTSGDDLVPNTANRFGGDTRSDTRLAEETSACVTVEAIIYPTQAPNVDKHWFFVANDKDIVQGVRVEKCAENNSECRFGQGTICRQRFIYRKLLAVDATGKMTAENFRIPSCCVCFIKNDFLSLINRFGARPSNASTPSAAATKPRPHFRRPNRRRRRQTSASGTEDLALVGGETTGLSGSPLDNLLSIQRAPEQGTAQQSIETENTLNPSDTIGGQPVGRFVGEIVVHSQPIVVQKRPKQRRN